MGKIIALSGVDGAGKTTIADALEKHYKNNGLKVKRISVFKYKLFSFLSKRRNTVEKKEKTQIVIKNNNKLLQLFGIFTLIDFWWNYLFYLMPLIKKYDAVIADRYFTDMLVSLQQLQYLPKFLYPKIAIFLPPANNFVIKIDPTEAHKRSQEFTLDYYKDQVILYKQLLDVAKMIEIPTESSVQKMVYKITSHVGL